VRETERETERERERKRERERERERERRVITTLINNNNTKILSFRNLRDQIGPRNSTVCVYERVYI
jgi:hypothetical protein